MISLPSIKRAKRIRHVQNGIKPVVLLVLDGWGIAPASEGNAITRAKTPNVDSIYEHYPHGELVASGESVGLPANEVGNSEVGHLTIGAGKPIYQSLKRINIAIEDDTFFDNRAFVQAAKHVKKFKSKIHLMGLVSSGSVHASIEHFYALLEFCNRYDLRKVVLHLFTDGRDAPPQEAISVIKEIDTRLKELKVGQIASISGRYYAMDRDRRWERTKRAYDAIVLGRGLQAESATYAIEMAYSKGQTDEFIEPTVVRNSQMREGTVDDTDAVVFFNFRVDRPRQLTMAFALSDFENLKSFDLGHKHGEGTSEGFYSGTTFKREKWPKNIFFVTMTEYQKLVPVSAIAFPPIKAPISLPQVLSENGLRQLHLTESEKERMVTIYFDGLNETRFPGEDVKIIPSPKVATYDKKPEMSVYKVVDQFEVELVKNQYNFFILNFANPDMVAHSGDVKATIKAIEHVDKAIGRVIELVLSFDGVLYITADHGNAEELLSFPSTSFFYTTSEGAKNTDHSNNPVPFLIIGNEYYGNPKKLPRGSLSDVAPTILTKMGLKVPNLMTGRDLMQEESNLQSQFIS